MSHPHESSHGIGSKSDAVVPVSISPELAEEAEDVLREFAEEAELSIALIVDRGASLVAGISSEEDIAVEKVSTLVSEVGNAVKTLVHELGEVGAIESIHQGGGRLLYLHDLLGRFILVGVSDAALPAGIIRRQAVPVRAQLSELLKEVEEATEAVSPKQAQRSLRITDMLRSPDGDYTKLEEEVESEEAGVKENAEDKPYVEDLESIITEEAAPTDEEEIPASLEKKASLVKEHLDIPVPVRTLPSEPAEQTPEEESEEPELAEEVNLPSFESDDSDSEQDEEQEISRPATIVVDSPFEAVVETEKDHSDAEAVVEKSTVAAENWGGSEEGIEIVDDIISEPKIEAPEEISSPPSIPEAQPILEESISSPETVDDEKTEDNDDETITGKTGPKYSFDLG